MNSLRDKIGFQLKLLMNTDNLALREDYGLTVDLSDAKMKIRIEVIESIYSNILLRPADPHGIKSLYSLIENDPIIETIIHSLCQSAEAKQNQIRYQNVPQIKIPAPAPILEQKQPGLFKLLKQTVSSKINRIRRKLGPFKRSLFSILQGLFSKNEIKSCN